MDATFEVSAKPLARLVHGDGLLSWVHRSVSILLATVQRAPVLLGLMILTDAAFTVLHIIHTLSPVQNSALYALGRDTSFPEMWQYVKWFWIAALLYLLAMRRRQWFYLTWAVLYTYLLADDAFILHERAGVLLAQSLHLPEVVWLRGHHVGELLAMAALGVTLLSPIALADRRGDRVFRRFSQGLLVANLVFSLFAVATDAVNALSRSPRRLWHAPY